MRNQGQGRACRFSSLVEPNVESEGGSAFDNADDRPHLKHRLLAKPVDERSIDVPWKLFELDFFAEVREHWVNRHPTLPKCFDDNFNTHHKTPLIFVPLWPQSTLVSAGGLLGHYSGLHTTCIHDGGDVDRY
jgi:hypothetical protein